MSEMYFQLKEDFKPEQIKSRPAPGGGNRRLSYVETHTVILRLNNATDGKWDFKVLSTTMQGDVMVAHVEMTIPGMGTRQHIGVQKVMPNAGEDLIKGAVSDALKKCATLFGVGIGLYGDDYEEYEHYEEPPVPVPVVAERAVIPAGKMPLPNSDKRELYLSLRQHFMDLCGSLLSSDVSGYTVAEEKELIDGIIGGDFKCAGERPSIGDYRRVIATMTEDGGA
jgi:hypothetical protein